MGIEYIKTVAYKMSSDTGCLENFVVFKKKFFYYWAKINEICLIYNPKNT